MKIHFIDPARIQVTLTTADGKRYVIEGGRIAIVAPQPFPTAKAFLRMWDHDFIGERSRSECLRAAVDGALRAINRREMRVNEYEAPLDSEYLGYGWSARW